jgi:cytosine/adenosine deaminase-related metal-dependent hydrolase
MVVRQSPWQMWFQASQPAHKQKRMRTLLIKNAYVATMDDHQREIPEGGLFIRGGLIEHVGPTHELPNSADEVLDLKGHVVLPGLVNTHHHFYQTLTRVVPAAQDANLFNWLTTLYPIWARLMPDDIFISTQTALAELALSGCTIAADHLYLFPNGAKLDDEIHAALEIGLRLQPRGSVSLGQSQGSLPGSSRGPRGCHSQDSQRLIEISRCQTWGDDADRPGSMLPVQRDRRIDEAIGKAGASNTRSTCHASG